MRTRTSAPRRSLRAVAAAPVLALLLVLVTLVSPLVPAPAASAVSGPENVSGASYLAWHVTDSDGALMGGATFEVQRSQQVRRWFGLGDFGDFGEFQLIATVGDCTASSCAATGDRDLDAGEFQVTTGIQTNTNSTRYRYRIRAVDSVSGPQMLSTAWSPETHVAEWDGNRFEFDEAFRASLRPAFSCTAGSFSTLAASGAVQSVTVSNGSASVLPLSPSLGLSSANAFGIAAGGESAFLVERASTTTGVRSIWRYSRADGWRLVHDVVNSASDAEIVAGAASNADGRYFFGGPLQTASGFQLFDYDHATGRARLLGTLSTGLRVNGDMGFNAAGDLVIVQGSSVFTVMRSALDAANGQAIASVRTTGASFSTNVNGIAFDSDDSVYASISDANTGAAEIRRHLRGASTWVLAEGAAVARVASTSDLASCPRPVTVSVRTDTPQVAVDGDRFQVAMRQGSTVLASGDSLSGVRVPTASPYILTQSIASRDGVDGRANYDTVWACTGGVQPANGSGSTIALTTPSTAGANVVCTFTNRTLVSNITIRKDMQDVDGANTAPRARWTVGAAVTSGATQVGSVTTSNQQTGVNGVAAWTIRHTGAGSNAQVTISEEQPQAGFEFVSGYCDVTPLDSTTARTMITKQGNDARALALTVAPGSMVDCVFTNKVRPTRLTLVKEVTFGTAATNLFTLRAAAPAAAPAETLPGPTGRSGTPEATNVRITPGIAYRLSESGGPATYAQVGSWTCVNQAGTAVAVTAAGDVTADQGDSVTCRVRNATAALVLLERIEGSSTLTPSEFSLTATPADVNTLQPTTVPGAAQVTSENTIQVRPGLSYSLVSASSVAHIGLRLECYTGPGSTSCLNGATAPTAAQLADQSNWRTQTASTASVAPGTTAYYRFVATSPTPFSLPMTGGVGTDQIQLLGGGLAVLALLTGLALLLHRRRRAA